jgi:hypothetical protein
MAGRFPAPATAGAQQDRTTRPQRVWRACQPRPSLRTSPSFRRAGSTRWFMAVTWSACGARATREVHRARGRPRARAAHRSSRRRRRPAQDPAQLRRRSPLRRSRPRAYALRVVAATLKPVLVECANRRLTTMPVNDLARFPFHASQRRCNGARSPRARQGAGGGEASGCTRPRAAATSSACREARERGSNDLRADSSAATASRVGYRPVGRRRPTRRRQRRRSRACGEPGPQRPQ